MTSVDTNILLYSLNVACPEHEAARAFMESLVDRDDIVLCELVLVELYILLRNPRVLARPLTAPAAASVCQGLRANPAWRLVEDAKVMSEVWQLAATTGFARRRIIDARLAFTLRHHGVHALATRNVKDFKGFGFERVWSPV